MLRRDCDLLPRIDSHRGGFETGLPLPLIVANALSHTALPQCRVASGLHIPVARTYSKCAFQMRAKQLCEIDLSLHGIADKGRFRNQVIPFFLQFKEPDK